jgi:pimeloyl-ACP methyl ester carboxylesterase
MAIPGIEDRIERIKSFDGTEIATAAWGDKDAPAVILSNGICCTDTYWTYLQPLLVEAGYRVVFFDYRGHNRSGRPGNPNEVGLPSHARDLWAAAEHHGVKEAVLVGHSMGVQTIFEAYRQHPDRVKGLVALAGPFEYPLDNIYMTPVGAILLAGLGLTLRRAPTPVRLVWEFMGRDNRFALNASRMLGVIGKHADKDLEGEYFDTLASLDPLLLVKFFEGMQIHSARDVLPTCDVPVLQIAGSRDMLTPMPLQREMASLLPNVRLEVLHGVTHTLPIDEPETVNKMTIDFIREVEGVGTPMIPEQADEQESSNLKSVG